MLAHGTVRIVFQGSKRTVDKARNVCGKEAEGWVGKDTALRQLRDPFWGLPCPPAIGGGRREPRIESPKRAILARWLVLRLSRTLTPPSPHRLVIRTALRGYEHTTGSRSYCSFRHRRQLHYGAPLPRHAEHEYEADQVAAVQPSRPPALVHHSLVPQHTANEIHRTLHREADAADTSRLRLVSTPPGLRIPCTTRHVRQGSRGVSKRWPTYGSNKWSLKSSSFST